MKNEATVGGITVAGQPTADELRSSGYATVINIRGAAEEGNITAEALAGSDTTYVAVPWTIDTVTDEDIARIRAAVESSDGPVLIH
jgi:protein tyrosine phosphatase (PTP) superfamily phosphohydrolase (DUF442 family)